MELEFGFKETYNAENGDGRQNEQRHEQVEKESIDDLGNLRPLRLPLRRRKAASGDRRRKPRIHSTDFRFRVGRSRTSVAFHRGVAVFRWRVDLILVHRAEGRRRLTLPPETLTNPPRGCGRSTLLTRSLRKRYVAVH